MERPFHVRLHILSPVHIGCDEEYEPTSFVIDPQSRELITFDPLVFISDLDEKERTEFSGIAGKGTLTSIIELYRFVSARRSRIKGRSVMVSEDIAKRYIEVKGLPLNEGRLKQELNNFRIPRTAFHPTTDTPYLPGSSLKGSLRTGYLSSLAVQKKVENRKNARDLEKELLKGAFDSDPFRLLKVSDLERMNDDRARIIYALNRKKGADGAEGRGIPQILEVVSPGSVFQGIINLERQQGGAIAEPLEIENLLRKVNGHYARVYNEEIKTAKKLRFAMPRPKAKKEEIMKAEGTPVLVRLGRHSGAEAVTIEGNRSIAVRGPGGRSTPQRSATTIWLGSERGKPTSLQGLIPFGWAMLEIVASH